MSDAFPLGFVLPDVLCLILGMVSGKDITRLFMAGNKSLNVCMLERGGVKSFEIVFEQPHEICVPPVVYSLRHLRLLHLSSRRLLKNCKISDFKPENLPKSLTSLKVAFCNANAFLLPRTGDELDLARMFPNMETMTLEEYPIRVRVGQLMLLPPLLSLDLHCGLELSLIALTPRTVTDLHLNLQPSYGFGANSEIDVPADFNPLFPPFLHRLDIQNVPSLYLMRDLPSTLKVLKVSFNYNVKENATPQHFWDLPRGLTELSWPSPSTTRTPFTLERAEALPRTLKHLHLWNAALPCDSLAAVIDALPLGLTAFFGVVVPLEDDVDWESVKISAQRVFVRLRSLSAQITAFCEKIGWCPPGATDIDSARSRKSFQYPKTLKSLSFQVGVEDTSWNPDQTPPMDLPASIEQLTRCFCINPSDLERLQSYSLLRSASLELEPEHLSLLPVNLEHLYWSVHNNGEASPTISLKHLARLKDCSIINNEILPSHQIWSSLPASLRFLSINGRGKGVPQGSMLERFNNEALPNLTELSVNSILQLQDPHLLNLPKRLLKLQLPGSQDEKLTAACLAQLPPNLISLSLPPLSTTDSSPSKHDHLRFLSESDARKLKAPSTSSGFGNLTFGFGKGVAMPTFKPTN